MSTRPTFEDRLLAELKRDIAFREQPPPATPPRRLLAPRRLAVVALPCALLGLASLLGLGPVLASEPPAQPVAYAVQGRGDGKVRLTVREQFISVEAQEALARALRPWEIHVTIDVLPPGYVCERSAPASTLVALDEQGDPVPVVPLKSSWDFTLGRGDLLAFENTAGDHRARAVEHYAAGTKAEPCVSLKLALPDRSKPKK
ncbi:hypothetical protein [Streptomyces sp. NPDC088254]|uniref:hypothetical protein n=1 Tax=Streptomyces sp. NPDC088254 TaxID=3365847 RepID=UPI003827CB3F